MSLDQKDLQQPHFLLKVLYMFVLMIPSKIVSNNQTMSLQSVIL